MKKISLISVVLVITFMFSSMAIAAKPQPPTPSGTVIYGCYQKVNGQLRIVNASSQCRPSELLISWNIVGLQGPAGPAGPAGPTGPQGIVATSTLSGRIETISASVRQILQFVFAGPTVDITTTALQRITGAVQAPLGTTTSGLASFNYDLCYRTAGTSDTLMNFTGANPSSGEVSDTAGRLSFTAAASVVPGAGTWQVGYCVLNSGTIDLNNNDMVNGWVIVTEE